jgi:hypothetical protein
MFGSLKRLKVLITISCLKHAFVRKNLEGDIFKRSIDFNDIEIWISILEGFP